LASTHELEIRFEEPDRAAARRAKEHVLERLAVLGITSFAEGVIDGVDLKIGEDGASPDFADDATPILVFDEDPAKLVLLQADLAGLGFALGFRRAELADEAWQQAWDEGDELIRTRRFVVWPEGRRGVKPPGLISLDLVKGEAFGSGRHATTQAALEALEDLPETQPRGPLLDVGTGTGILAIAAHHLGFGPLLGTEIDAAAIAEARRNAGKNGVNLQLLETAEPPANEVYQLIVANILVPVLHHLLPRLQEQLAPRGRIVLAGFIDKEATPLLAAAERLGLVEDYRRVCRGWVGLVLKKRV
jgi:ribosomal protein L11 methyltransferase